MHRARELAKRDASEALVKILGNAYRAILKDKIALFKSEFGMDSKRATIKATEEVCWQYNYYFKLLENLIVFMLQGHSRGSDQGCGLRTRCVSSDPQRASVSVHQVPGWIAPGNLYAYYDPTLYVNVMDFVVAVCTGPHVCGESDGERAQRQAAWVQETLHTQAMALAALDTRPLPYAERYRYLLQLNNQNETVPLHYK
ncbi:hypothetical protein B5M09_012712 [Aphanomyces astaci]|uniref:Uncharacterized protein n=1 Tax=Aphanomyces astaci TaxID=112090 RepID=A0A425DM45_APHAT|nr:hypothetical protein B5M09_012712 [Aphanomyces astaci]